MAVLPSPSSRRRPGSSGFRLASTAAERRWILTFVRMTEKRGTPVGLISASDLRRARCGGVVPPPDFLPPMAVLPSPSSRRRPGSSGFRRASTAVERRWILTFVRMSEKRGTPVGLINASDLRRTRCGGVVPPPDFLPPMAVLPSPSSRRRPGSSGFRRASTAAERRWILTFVRMTEKRGDAGWSHQCLRSAKGAMRWRCSTAGFPSTYGRPSISLIPAQAGIQWLSSCIDVR